MSSYLHAHIVPTKLHETGKKCFKIFIGRWLHLSSSPMSVHYTTLFCVIWLIWCSIISPNVATNPYVHPGMLLNSLTVCNTGNPCTIMREELKLYAIFHFLYRFYSCAQRLLFQAKSEWGPCFRSDLDPYIKTEIAEPCSSGPCIPMPKPRIC